MTAQREHLPIGWRPAPALIALLLAVALLAAAAVIHAFGLVAGLAVLGAAPLAGCLAWAEAWTDGPSLGLRSLRTGFTMRMTHARSVDRMLYRRRPGPSRLRIVGAAEHRTIIASGRAPDAPAFRQASMWLIVHGRRHARIDPALLDALAAMPDHAQAGLPHDTSHA